MNSTYRSIFRDKPILQKYNFILKCHSYYHSLSKKQFTTRNNKFIKCLLSTLFLHGFLFFCALHWYKNWNFRGNFIHSYWDWKYFFQLTLHLSRGMSDSLRYFLNLWLVKDKWDILVCQAKNFLFSTVVSMLKRQKRKLT